MGELWGWVVIVFGYWVWIGIVENGGIWVLRYSLVVIYYYLVWCLDRMG